MRLAQALEVAVTALKEISKGRGGYSQDRLTHAENTIEDMKGLAVAAVAEIEKGRKNDSRKDSGSKTTEDQAVAGEHQPGQ
jgi:hypothetical protein